MTSTRDGTEFANGVQALREFVPGMPAAGA